MAKWSCPKCGADMYCYNTSRGSVFKTRRYRCLCGTGITTRETFAHITNEYVKPSGKSPYLATTINGKRTPIHIAVAERALGRKLPKGTHVHHVDGDSRNNDPLNLVICPSDAYHSLLHVRTDAYNSCGYADWRKCVFCKKWDAPSALDLLPSDRQTKQPFHRSCRNAYYRQIQN